MSLEIAPHQNSYTKRDGTAIDAVNLELRIIRIDIT
jgi:hypothetical protein